MHKTLFYFIDKINIQEIFKLKLNINIILRNYNENFNIAEILKLKKICKQQRRKLFISNDNRIANQLRLDGIYIPSFNNKIFVDRTKNLTILGSAHNLKEINIKKFQNVEYLFLSSLYKNTKSKNFLGPIKFNLLSKNFNKKIIALGGINKHNINMINNINCVGFAGIRYFKK